MFGFILAGVVLVFILYQFWYFHRKKKLARVTVFEERWRGLLLERSTFYKGLSDQERVLFEDGMLDFLSEVKITGVKTRVIWQDKVMVAAAGLTPIFHLGETTYPNLTEVLIYPSSFNRDHQTTGDGRNILGMVGSGYMTGTMILSKPQIHGAFHNSTDGRNTPIHEFMHLIDGWDGDTDGIPSSILEAPETMPWIKLIESGIKAIKTGESSLDPYAATNSAEFFAVAGEYLFEKPERLKKDHPEFYEALIHSLKIRPNN
jgi:MtfA peptidase